MWNVIQFKIILLVHSPWSTRFAGTNDKVFNVTEWKEKEKRKYPHLSNHLASSTILPTCLHLSISLDSNYCVNTNIEYRLFSSHFTTQHKRYAISERKKKEKRRRQKRLRSWNKLHQCFEDYSVISIRFERCENAQYVLCARLIAVIISCCSFIVLYAYYVCCIHCIHSVLVGVVDCSSFCIGLLPLAFIAPAFQLMFPLKSAT